MTRHAPLLLALSFSGGSVISRFLVPVLLLTLGAWKVPAQDGNRAPKLEWEIAIEKKLAQEATGDFVGEPLLDCVELLSESYEVPILLDPRILEKGEDLLVTLKLNNLRLKDVLSVLASLHNLVVEIACGAVVLTRAERVASLPRRVPSFGSAADPEGEAVQKQLARLRLTLDFRDTVLKDVVEYLNDVLDSGVAASSRLGKKKVSFTLKNFRVDQSLTLLAWGVGGKLRYTHGVLQIVPGDRTH